MVERRGILLEQRAVLRLTGEDRRAFLQGLVSNDVEKAGRDRAIHAAFLTPQGKFLHEFFLVERDDAFLIDCEAARRDDFRKRLSMYRLRSKVAVEAADDLAVYALIGDGAAEAAGLSPQPGAAGPLGGGVAFVDSRLAEAGLRAILSAAGAAVALEQAGFPEGAFAEWDRLRLSLGLPDGSRDMEIEKAILLENGFEELNGVDFQKGCYMGQELTARTKYRGLVKKRLMPVAIDGPAPAPGTPLMLGGKEAGEMRSSCGDLGLAVVRLEALEGGAELVAGEARLRPTKPGWAKF